MRTQIGTLFPGKSNPNPDYVNVIRTDARFSTKFFQKQLSDHLITTNSTFDKNAARQDVKEAVHHAYATWGHAVVEALKFGTSGTNTNVDDELDHTEYHLHDAQKLASLVVDNAHGFDKESVQEPLLISLDDIISSLNPELDDIAFSRLFSMDGRTYYDYVARPGYDHLNRQFDAVRDSIEHRYEQSGQQHVPLVLLEDNVRHARMLNWLFNKMADHGLLEKASVVGISSCFCCASEGEQRKIISKDKIIPVKSVVEYNGASIDVITPRDLMFDGFVVDINGTNTRLPGIFMDVKSRFNIEAEYEEAFLHKIIDANIEFCRTIEKKFGVAIPVEWFATAPAMCHVTGAEERTKMTDLMEAVRPVNRLSSDLQSRKDKALTL